MAWFGGKVRVEQLVREHYAALFRFAWRLSGSSQDAEDLTQETFCQAQDKLAQLRDRSKARSWLFTILRNTYLHRVRSAKHHPCISLEDVSEIPERTTDALPEIEPEQLQQALNEMPEIFRTPLILYYFEEFSYREIAEQMGAPVGTIMSRLARAKSFLRARLLQPAGMLGQGLPREVR